MGNLPKTLLPGGLQQERGTQQENAGGICCRCGGVLSGMDLLYTDDTGGNPYCVSVCVHLLSVSFVIRRYENDSYNVSYIAIINSISVFTLCAYAYGGSHCGCRTGHGFLSMA